MKLENRAPRDYMAFDVILKANSTQDVTNKQAIAILLKQEGVREFVDVSDKKELEAENENLKKELAKLQQVKDNKTMGKTSKHKTQKKSS